MSLMERSDIRQNGNRSPAALILCGERRSLDSGLQPADPGSDDPSGQAAHPRPSSQWITLPSQRDLRLSGSKAGDWPGWPEDRIQWWLVIFMGLGNALRLIRFALNFPLWNDEGFLALNV